MSLYERTLKMIQEEKRPKSQRGVMTTWTLWGESEPPKTKNVQNVTCAGEVETRLRFFSNTGDHFTHSFTRASDSLDTFETLPEDCPLKTDGSCPPECRFETRFLVRMVKYGVLPDPVKGCPVLHVCGMSTKRHKRFYDTPKCFNIKCEHSEYKQHDGIDQKWCSHDRSPVIEMDKCPIEHWQRDTKGLPVLNLRRKDTR